MRGIALIQRLIAFLRGVLKSGLGSFIGNCAKIDGDCALLLRFRAVLVSVCAYLGCFCALKSGLRSFYLELRPKSKGIALSISLWHYIFSLTGLLTTKYNEFSIHSHPSMHVNPPSLHFNLCFLHVGHKLFKFPSLLI